MPRDALWVLPNGVTAVVTVDDDGNRIEDAPAAAEAPEDPAKPPEPPRQKRGRRNRH